MNREQFEEFLDTIGADWQWLGGNDYAVCLANEGEDIR